MEGQLDLFGNFEKAIEPSEAEKFKAECIEFVIADGTGFLHGKDRVLDAYNKGELTKQFLKKEYGCGGHSVTWRDGKRGYTDHDASGIRCIKYGEGNDNVVVVFAWKEVVKILSEAIYEGKYKAEKVKWNVRKV